MVTLALTCLIFLLLFILYISIKIQGSPYILIVFISMWLMALISLLFFESDIVNNYCSSTAFLFIGMHFIFFSIGNIFFAQIKQVRIPKIPIEIMHIYFILFALSFLGTILIAYSINLKQYILEQQIVQLRDDGFEGNININKYFKFLSNFIYPFSVVAGMAFSRYKNFYLLFALVSTALVFSLINGGKGSLLIISILFIGGLIFSSSRFTKAENGKLKWGLTFMAILLMVYIVYISYSRMLADNKEFDLKAILKEIFIYFSYSIPAFSKWLSISNLSYLGFDLRQLSISREIVAFGGGHIDRVVDKTIVYIPEQFNVFTAFGDSILAFGYIGSLLYYTFIGGIIRLIDKNRKDNKMPFLYALFFLFVSYSLFTDIFFFMIGAWLCLLFNFIFKIKETSV